MTQTIKMTFPVSCPPEDVIDIIQQNIIENTPNKCVVSLLEKGEKSNTYQVIANNAETFYHIGITVGTLLLYKEISKRNYN